MSHLSEEQLDEMVARERARDYPPLNDWRTIAASAREEGLIADERAGWSSAPWIRAAAAVVLLVGGIAIGRTTIGLPESSGPASTGAPEPVTATAGVPRINGNASRFASVDEATAALDRAVAEYQRATAYLAANSLPAAATTDSSQIYLQRLAALNAMGEAMDNALKTAPHDPVINQYYLSTMGARVATQQLVNRPVSLALRGF